MTSQDILELSPISSRRSHSVRDSGLAPLPVLDRYRLSSLLGKGGMAEVFLAVWRVAPDVVRPVVVKRLYDHFSEDRAVVQMFIDEARLVCQLDHKHIVKTFEIGLIDGHLCIVMEYLEGQTLQQLMRRSLECNGIPVPLAAYIGQAVLAGLAFAHEATDARGDAREIVHRDISPHNIFITNTGAVKILDFGIAKARTHEARTSTGVVKGKFAYIAPEQAAGLPVDGRADLFSLGVVLWEMLAGRRLFKAEGDAATLNA
ncbi:MAG TPA: serine/threonine-protein kinase, partial [Polyangiaceae bacterium]|nr:serine/threonine-protein kinase [Polyangiaceae bacterium]